MMRKSQYATNTIKNIQYYKRKKENSRKPLNIHLSIQTSYSESLGLNICLFIILFILIFLCYVFSLQRQVFIKVSFLKIGEIDTLKENFSADVYIQSRWREPQLDKQAANVSY